jgi:dephospho-CoA kinase
MRIIGITGTIGSGKGEVVEYLKQKEFVHFSARAFILEEVRKRGLEPTRAHVFVVANDLRRMHGASYIIQSLYKKAVEGELDSVIESIRAVGELDFLRAQKNFTLIAVDADPKIRYERTVKRGSELDHVTFEKFMENERNEMKSVNPHELDIDICMKRADVTLMNNGTKEELYKEVEKVLQKIQAPN